MPTARVPQAVDEIVVMDVPPHMAAMPEPLRTQFAWWQVVRGVLLQEDVIPLGPPTDIEYTFTDDVGVVSGIKLRHPCDECRDGLTQAIDALRSGRSKAVAVIQFSQTYFRRVEDLDSPYVVRNASR
jgi:hypothetical protein